MVVSLYFGGKSHVSNAQNVSFKEPCSISDLWWVKRQTRNEASLSTEFCFSWVYPRPFGVPSHPQTWSPAEGPFQGSIVQEPSVQVPCQQGNYPVLGWPRETSLGLSFSPLFLGLSLGFAWEPLGFDRIRAFQGV